MVTVRVSRKGALRWASGHPWIFMSDVVDSGGAGAGDVVRVTDAAGTPIGTAHWSSTSQISLRLLDRQMVTVDRDFFLGRLRQAQALRQRVVRDTDAYRLVHGEADLLPGLIVDRYGDCLVVQFLSQGMHRAGPVIVNLSNGSKTAEVGASSLSLMAFVIVRYCFSLRVASRACSSAAAFERAHRKESA